MAVDKNALLLRPPKIKISPPMGAQQAFILAPGISAAKLGSCHCPSAHTFVSKTTFFNGFFSRRFE